MASNYSAMFQVDIDYIARSPFAKAAEGGQILALLRNLYAHGNITYGDTGGDRGCWDGSAITVRDEFVGNMCKTIPTLVHEASHAIWRFNHPIHKAHKESIDAAIDNELYAQENELAIYKWMRDVQKFCGVDLTLDTRLERQARGALKSVIVVNERENRETKP